MQATLSVHTQLAGLRSTQKIRSVINKSDSSWPQFDDGDDREDFFNPHFLDDPDDDDPYDPEPLDDEIYDDFDFEVAPEDGEIPPDELWDDADWE
jgi:hypothetical protein